MRPNPQAAPASAPPTPPPPEELKDNILGTIERLDRRLDAIIPKGARIEKLADGFHWAEGPVWFREGYLLFSDVPGNTVYKWREGDGTTVHLQPSGYTGSEKRGGEPGSNGLTLDREGRLILCQHGDRRVARIEKDGRMTPLAVWYRSSRLNSPNDVVVRSNGEIYFTDPPYGLVDPAASELGFQGVYRIHPETLELTLLIKELTRPNGLAFSPDERSLYIANSDPEKAVWMKYDVMDDNTIASGRVIYDATPWVKEGRKGLPDGMKVDLQGNLFATGPGGVIIMDGTGKLLGRIDTGVATANVAFGEDGATLFITANHSLCRIRLATRGKIPGTA